MAPPAEAKDWNIIFTRLKWTATVSLELNRQQSKRAKENIFRKAKSEFPAFSPYQLFFPQFYCDRIDRANDSYVSVWASQVAQP